MRKYILTLIFYFLTITFTKGQNNPVWTQIISSINSQNLNPENCKMKIDQNGNTYVLAQNLNQDFNHITYLRKYTSDGEIEWADSIVDDYFYLNFEIDYEFNIYLYGNISEAGKNFLFFKKYSSAGFEIYFKKINSFNNFYIENYCISFDSENNILIAGNRLNSSTNYQNLILEKLTKNGDFLWSTIYPTTCQNSKLIWSIVNDLKGNSFLLSKYSDQIDSANVLLCFDNNGKFDWKHNLSGLYKMYSSLQISNDSILYFISNYQDQTDATNIESTGFSICNFKTSGELVWSKSFWSDEIVGDSNLGNATSIKCDKYGNFYFVANIFSYGFRRGGLIMKLNSDGNKVWSKPIGTTCGTMSYSYFLLIGNDERIYTLSHANDFCLQAVNTKVEVFNNSGEFEGILLYAGMPCENYKGFYLCLDAKNNIYITGTNNNSFISTKFASDEISSYLNSNPEVKIYPNPTPDYLLIEGTGYFGGENGTSYEVYNLLGQKILSGSTRFSYLYINISDLPSGVYFVSLFIANYSCVKKIIKQ